MTPSPRLERSPRQYSVYPRDNRHVLRSAVLGLMIYGLGLLPFFFLTPAWALFGFAPQPTSSTVLASPPTAGASQTVVTPSAKTGANALSVAGPTVVATVESVSGVAVAATDSRYAFLLMGYGGSGHDGAYLTDSMMLVVVNPDQKTLTMLSFPRDTWVPMFFDGRNPIYNKVNTAYAFAQDPTLYPERLAKYDGDSGAGVFAADTISRLLGVPVKYYLGLDFTGFRQMINTVGGIDVTVPATFSARYPANDDPSIDASWTTVKFTAGTQHMTGERAIEFARARESLDNLSEGTDFARSRRQRLIIEAFKNRLFEPGGLLHLPQLIGIGATHVDTNYSLPDAALLSQLALSWHDVKIYQTALTIQNYLEEATGPDGTYALVPSSSSHSWAAIRFFARRLWADPATGVALAQTRIVVENDTGLAGAGLRLSNVLVGLGYSVDSPTTGPIHDGSRLVDSSGQNAASALLPILQQDLQLSGLDLIQDPSAVTGEVTLQLGTRDLKSSDLQPLTDPSAPSSNVGIVGFGSWSPDLGTTFAVTSPTPNDAHRIPVASRSVTPESGRTTTPTDAAAKGASTPGARSTGTPRPSHTPTPHP